MATWFAQNSSVNIDSVNQWNSAADGSGSWLTWASLGASDILVTNNKTSIAINADFTCATITNTNTYGGTAGGGFTVSAARTITCNIERGAVHVITTSGTGYTFTLNGNITGGTAAGQHGLNVATAVTVVVNGNVAGSTSNNGVGILMNANSTLTINGNVTGSSSASGYPVSMNSSGALTITGTVTASAGPAIDSRFGSGQITINGSIVDSSTANALFGGKLKWVPGASGTWTTPTTSGNIVHFPNKNLGQGMRGGFNG